MILGNFFPHTLCDTQVAAGLGSDSSESRVLGVASISSQCDLYHKTAPEQGSREWKALMPSGGAMMANACAPDAGCWGSIVRNLFLKQVLGSMCYSERKDQDFGFKQLYVDSQRKGDGGSEGTWSAMDKDPFFVSKNLYCVLHGCNAKTTTLVDIWRLFGKWDYDCADFAGPCFIYNGDPETTPATMAEQIHRSIPQVLARKDENTNQVNFSVRAVDHDWARAHDHHDGGGQYHPGSDFRENRSSDFSFPD